MSLGPEEYVGRPVRFDTERGWREGVVKSVGSNGVTLRITTDQGDYFAHWCGAYLQKSDLELLADVEKELI